MPPAPFLNKPEGPLRKHSKLAKLRKTLSNKKFIALGAAYLIYGVIVVYSFLDTSQFSNGVDSNSFGIELFALALLYIIPIATVSYLLEFIKNLKTAFLCKEVTSALAAFFVTYIMFIFFFGALYSWIYHDDHTTFSFSEMHQALFFWDFIYFSITTATTLGYGDIHPTTILTQVLASVQVMASVFIMTIYLTVVLNKTGKDKEEPRE